MWNTTTQIVPRSGMKCVTEQWGGNGTCVIIQISPRKPFWPAQLAWNRWAGGAHHPCFPNLVSSGPQTILQASRHTAVCIWQIATHFDVQWLSKATKCNSSLETFGNPLLFMSPLSLPDWQLKVTFPCTSLPAVSNFPKLNTIFCTW